MWTAFALLAIFLLVVLVLATRRKKRPPDDDHWPVFARPVLSKAEQVMYHRLVKAFPKYLILPQVSVAQFIHVKQVANFQSIHNRFNRLRADFVICQQDFTVLAVMELDDRSHDRPKRQAADQRKSAVLLAAGIPLHRLNVNPMPGEAELRELLAN